MAKKLSKDNSDGIYGDLQENVQGWTSDDWDTPLKAEK